jgi:small redox-active disulfide protein 2
MLIQVLGPGCPRCSKLAEHAEAAAQAVTDEYLVEKVTDINRITAAGVMMTPALMIDGQVKLVGKVPSIDELKALFSEETNK